MAFYYYVLLAIFLMMMPCVFFIHSILTYCRHSTKGKSMDISISIGSAALPDDSIDTDEIVKFADIAMYEAKQDRGSSYKNFDSRHVANGHQTS